MPATPFTDAPVPDDVDRLAGKGLAQESKGVSRSVANDHQEHTPPPAVGGAGAYADRGGGVNDVRRTTLDARGERRGEEDEAEKGDGQALHKPPPDGRNATPGGGWGQRATSERVRSPAPATAAGLGLAPRPSDRRDPNSRSTVTNSANHGSPPGANAHLGLLPPMSGPPQLRGADTFGMSISSRPVRLYREEAERLVPLAAWGTTEKGRSGILMGAGSK